uniref:Ig-like domain-containing protein n=1 Tax=Periophthalmus magnuspinnatus TaxID=409849 RepID=A0A3B4B944_9GOBI
MQDGSWKQPLPMSVLLKDPVAGHLEGDGGVFSEASSDGELYMDPAPELDSGDGDFADLTSFLSAEEINLSLDLAREAFGDTSVDPGPTPLSQEQALTGPTQTVDLTPSPHIQTKAPCPNDSPVKGLAQQRPVQLPKRSGSASEFCSRAASFIEELSSIFKGTAHTEQPQEEESSSPDSGYLSPRSQRPVPQGSASVPPVPPSPQDISYSPTAVGPLSGALGPVAAAVQYQQSGAPVSCGPLSPPHFLHKLKSQEVAEGSPIRLECRVTGNPLPLVRWFCEGRELHSSPDIQILRDGDLHTLVINEAFEDDTGRYTCVASNSLGADNTSAEVYIEGKWVQSDTLVQKKTTSMSLTIRSSSPKTTEVLPRRTTLVQALAQPPPRVAQHYHTTMENNFVQRVQIMNVYYRRRMLQDAQASEGQVVVLECRVRGSPRLQVRWYREGEEILDSPDFRILQKKPRSAAEPEEICTLVIAEAFPEDGGVFSCSASNPFGSVNCSARLTVTAGQPHERKNVEPAAPLLPSPSPPQTEPAAEIQAPVPPAPDSPPQNCLLQLRTPLCP